MAKLQPKRTMSPRVKPHFVAVMVGGKEARQKFKEHLATGGIELRHFITTVDRHTTVPNDIDLALFFVDAWRTQDRRDLKNFVHHCRNNRVFTLDARDPEDTLRRLAREGFVGVPPIINDTAEPAPTLSSVAEATTTTIEDLKRKWNLTCLDTPKKSEKPTHEGATPMQPSTPATPSVPLPCKNTKEAGKLLRERRMALGLSGLAAAELLKCSDSTINKIEAGEPVGNNRYIQLEYFYMLPERTLPRNTRKRQRQEVLPLVRAPGLVAPTEAKPVQPVAAQPHPEQRTLIVKVPQPGPELSELEQIVVDAMRLQARIQKAGLKFSLTENTLHYEEQHKVSTVNPPEYGAVNGTFARA